MEMIKLYRTKNPNGTINVGPEKPTDSSYTEAYRLVAYEGKVITDGTDTYYCIDTDEPDKYTEIDEPVEEETIEVEE